MYLPLMEETCTGYCDYIGNYRKVSEDNIFILIQLPRFLSV